ncbi:MAG: hypothetical protein WBQ50_20735 [Nocardioides sp.]
MPERRLGSARTDTGPGRVLVAVYAVFAVAATGRSTVQLALDAGQAPLAYSLSALAAVIYLVATVCLARPGPATTRIAWAAVITELVGVVSVGTLSRMRPELFPDSTVWSQFGAGYGYLPLVLPVAGLAWLTSRLRSARSRG